ELGGWTIAIQVRVPYINLWAYCAQFYIKKRNSRVWCKMMLEKGIAVTIGPVGEPYVQAFPIPEVFFGLLINGYLTLSECYQISLPYLSWKMVLIGDPLYRPFKNLRGKN
ncbi:MAG: TIGR03790 family protein, partial [Desulfobacterales bacterium]